MSEIPQASISLKSYACPHCGAHAAQRWFRVSANGIRSETRVPTFPDSSKLAALRKAAAGTQDQAEREKMVGEPFLHSENYISADLLLSNVSASACHTCQEIALWVHDRLIYPARLSGPVAHADLPGELKADVFLQPKNFFCSRKLREKRDTVISLVDAK